MRPEIVAPAIARAAARIAEQAPVESERERLSADLAAVTAELERLTDALSRGGELPSLLAAIQAREARRRELRDALTRVTAPITSPWLQDLACARQALRQRLRQWHRLVGRNTVDARRLLRAVLAAPIVLTPQERGARRVYEYQLRVSLGWIVTGVLDPTSVASPMPASWNQIVAWLKQIDAVRQAA